MNQGTYDPVNLQKSIVKGLKAIKSQKHHILNKILLIVDPTNDRELFKQINKHYSRFGNNTKMNLERLSCFCTTQVDGIEKLEWLKIWNFDNKKKHATRFLMDITRIERLKTWMTQKNILVAGM
jgi:hypothetical protein